MSAQIIVDQVTGDIKIGGLLVLTTATGLLSSLFTTTGQIIYSSSGSTVSALGIGSTGQVLTVSGGVPIWSNVSAANVNLTSTYIGYGSSGGVLTGISDLTFVNSSTPKVTIGGANGTGSVILGSSGSAYLTAPSGGALSIFGATIGLNTNGSLQLTINASGALGFGASPSYGTTGQVLTSAGNSASPTWSSAGTGTVTSVAVSGGTTGLTTSGGPITTTGTITFAGTLAIANGGTGQTTKTAAFDGLSPTTTSGDTIYYNGTHNVRLAVGSSGQVLTVSGGEPAWLTPTAATVTSVGLADASSVPIYAITNSPVTSSGTIDITLNTQTANKVFAGPSSGGAAQPTFRTLVSADIPTLNQNTTGYAAGLAGGIASQIPYQTAANTTAFIANGTTGQVLTSNGTGTPSWQTASAGSVTLTATQIAYGNASNVLTGTSDFTWTDSSQVLQLGNSGVSANVEISANNSANGINLFLNAGDSNSSGTGGNVQISGGTGTGGGNIYLYGGNSGSTITIYTPSGGILFSGNNGSTTVNIDSHSNLIYHAAIADQSYGGSAPTNGFTITLANNKSAYALNPAGTLATGTINMPSTPIDGQEVKVVTSQIVTALTVSGNGNTIYGAPTTITPASGFHYIYINAYSAWFRIS